MKYTVMSLFDGISGGQLALRKINVKVKKYYSCEVNKDAIRVTKQRFPETVFLGDIRDYASWKIKFKKIDILFAGFPCQAWSKAGLQLGLKDDRSDVITPLLKILKKARKNKKLIVLFENVTMSMENRRMLTKLFGLVPTEMNSSLVSGQLRNRVYWTTKKLEQPQDRKILLEDIITSGCVDRDKSLCITKGYYRGGSLRNYFDYSTHQLVFEIDGYRSLTTEEREVLQTLPKGYTDVGISETSRKKLIGDGWTIDMIAHILKQLV